jgi:hypothetical protein
VVGPIIPHSERRTLHGVDGIEVEIYLLLHQVGRKPFPEHRCVPDLLGKRYERVAAVDWTAPVPEVAWRQGAAWKSFVDQAIAVSNIWNV